jgi:DNA topoisomerase-2
MLLVNGARGIGTGYSTYIPPVNPQLLIDGLKSWLTGDCELNSIKLEPWFAGFSGTITKDKDYIVKGKWKVEKDIMTITELPVETWTSDYKEFLDKLESEGTIKDFTDTSTDTDVHIRIKLTGNSEHLAVLEKSLQTKLKLTNMHAFNPRGVIHKYESYHEILEEYAHSRLELYQKRRDHLLNVMRNKLPYHENVVRFIRQQCEEKPKPDLRRKTSEQCEQLLTEEKFMKIKDSYDYLLNLPIASLTLKHAQKHESDLAELQKKIKTLEGLTSEDLWFNDLEAFSEMFNKSK